MRSMTGFGRGAVADEHFSISVELKTVNNRFLDVSLRLPGELQSLESVINMSINQTLSRTVMASGLTFLAVLALWLLGPDTLNGFSFALVVGILVGTYSSVFIASPLVIWWNNWRGGAELVAPAVAAPKAAVAAPAVAAAKPARDKSRDKARAGR